MTHGNGLKKAATYLPPELHEALRKRAFDNHRTISSELKAMVEELTAEDIDTSEEGDLR